MERRARFIAQSFVGWTNAREGGPVKTEEDPLDPHPLAVTASALTAIRHLEEVVPKTVPEGLVLRYGILYGHGASDALLEAARKRQLPVVGGGTASRSGSAPRPAVTEDDILGRDVDVPEPTRDSRHDAVAGNPAEAEVSNYRE
jgi:hypothetical protein